MNAITEYIRLGGIYMYPIIFGSFFALMLMVERTIFYFQTGANLSSQIRKLFTLLENDNADSALEFLKKQKGILGNVMTIALKNRHLPSERVEEKMESILLEQLPGYSRFLNLIAALAGLMPIFGLLGTVSGMIKTFNVIALHGTGDAQAMASGIAEALITTEAGLVAAAPIILGHVLLTSRLKKVSDKTRESCVKVMNYLKDGHV